MELSNVVKKICIDKIDSWRGLKEENVLVEILPGGLSNLMFICRVQSGVNVINYPVVVVRYYGSGSHHREFELEICRLLSSTGVCPAYISTFDSGDISEFIENEKITHLMLPDLYQRIFPLLRKFHDSEIETLNRDNCFMKLTSIWSRQIREHLLVVQEENDYDFFDVDTLDRERDWLIEQLDSLDMPTVFSHNDLQEGNMLIETYTNRLVFIDFEYTGFNYRGYDFGNHLCEYTYAYLGNTFEFSPDLFPSDDHIRNCVRAYLFESDVTKVESMVDQAKKCTAASHLLWSYWSVAMFINNKGKKKIDFDYISYGMSRKQNYYASKSKYF